MRESRPQPELTDLLRILWRRRWALLACLIVIPALTYGFSSALGKTYEAETTLQVQATAVDTTLIEGGSTAPQAGIVTAAARLIQTTGVAQAAARELDRPPSPEALLNRLTVTPDEEGGFIEIAAIDSDPQGAADTANAFATATVASRARQARERVDRAISALEEQIERVDDRLARRQLSDQLQRLKALRAAQGSNAEVIEPASAPDTPISPKPVRNTAIAAILALLVGIALAFLLERLDRRLRSAEELAELTGLPLLASVPDTAFPDHDHSSQDIEAFQTLRASLTYFNVERPIKSIVICSPSVGDGKTTVATNLARAVAAGGKDVILVDADLRRPQAGSRLGISVDKGLADVLASEAALEDTLVETPAGRLRLLPAGSPPPNPAALLSSERMQSLLGELTQMTELVIVDSTPILPISDVMPLLGQVSGVVAVGRLNHTTRDAMQKFQDVVGRAGGRLLGVVATGDVAGGFYGYGGYGYGYGVYTREPAAAKANGQAPEEVSDSVTPAR